MANIENAGFKTIDGLTLRVLIYPACGRGSGVILKPGVGLSNLIGSFRTTERVIGVQFNCVKEMMNLPDVAEGFQRAEITALIYDPRTTGLSDGMPRNDIDPMKQVEDDSDALTFLGDHPMVDRNQMAFWGGIFCWHGVTVRCVSRQESQACYCCLPYKEG